MKRLVNLLNLILVLSVSHAWALSSDREQPINIESDTAELNEKTGVSTYRGRVVLTQGTLIIHSDTLVIYTNEEDIERVVAQGNPATYRQTGWRSPRYSRPGQDLGISRRWRRADPT